MQIEPIGPSIPAGLLKGVSGGIVIAQAGVDYLAPTGDGSQLTGITQDQVANLVTDLTAINLAIADINNDPTIVRTSGSYANPDWITSLAGSKVTGNISSSAANVTGTVAVANGGTGATNASSARSNLGAADDSDTVHKTGSPQTVSASTRFTGGLSSPGATDESNQFFGPAAGAAVTTGVQNCAYGVIALSSIEDGVNNTAFGYGALASLPGNLSENTAFGYTADAAKEAGTGCTAIGSRSSTGAFTNAIAIGATCTASNQIMLGVSIMTVVMPGTASVASWLQLGTSTDAAIPNGGIAWSLTNPDVLKVRTPSGTLKVVSLT